jgi:hypothetical protein
MTDGQRDLIHYRMERAFETLQEARLMLENDMTQQTESIMPVSTRPSPYC